MTNVYFHCANEEHEFAAKRGVAIDNLVEACEHAQRIVRSYVMTASAEDWRSWVLLRHRRTRRGDFYGPVHLRPRQAALAPTQRDA